MLVAGYLGTQGGINTQAKHGKAAVWGRRGGRNRARALSAERRREIARLGGLAKSNKAAERRLRKLTEREMRYQQANKALNDQSDDLT